MRLFPQTVDFFKLFEEQADNLRAAAKIVAEIEADCDTKKESIKMKSVEHRADDITHDIYSALNNTFITPIDREDIASLAGNLDDVIDELERAVNRIDLYNIKPFPKEIFQYFHLVERSILEVAKGVSELQNHKSRGKLLKHCEITNFIENEADELHRATLGYLFKEETDPIKIIKLKEVYDLLENVTDRAEDVANALERIVIKNS